MVLPLLRAVIDYAVKETLPETFLTHRLYNCLVKELRKHAPDGLGLLWGLFVDGVLFVWGL